MPLHNFKERMAKQDESSNDLPLCSFNKKLTRLGHGHQWSPHEKTTAIALYKASIDPIIGTDQKWPVSSQIG